MAALYQPAAGNGALAKAGYSRADGARPVIARRAHPLLGERLMWRLKPPPLLVDCTLALRELARRSAGQERRMSDAAEIVMFEVWLVRLEPGLLAMEGDAGGEAICRGVHA